MGLLKKKLTEMTQRDPERETLNIKLEQADQRLADVLRRLTDRLNQRERASGKVPA